MKLRKEIFIEILWLAIPLGLTAILGLITITGSGFINTIDFHFNDTYLVLIPYQVLLPVFLLLTFLIFFIKESRCSYKRRLSNWILLIAGLALVLILTFIIKIFAQLFPGEWSIYPPLSDPGSDKLPEVAPDPVSDMIIKFLVGIQAIIMGMLLYVAYRWGMNRGRQQLKSNALN